MIFEHLKKRLIKEQSLNNTIIENDENNNNDKKLLFSKDDLLKPTKSAFIEPNNKECERVVTKTLMEEMVKLGCLPPVIKCKPCKEESFGYFEPGSGLTICNNIKTYSVTLRNTILHEMIHAYDTCRYDLDTDNCIHLACTEIRAANLSGDCKFSQELGRGNLHIYNHMADCTKRRAIKSLEAHPKCKANAELSVLKAWEKCNTDYSPFTTIPK
ncbi:hypothetical protein PPL_02017 [Heterostelium album PN500]|uniref:Mitochondrial inner membrane protease ATP23 n=1 Tax=Heterostelium pallidum (strain ATCC 26659 / Pp 5 / PN500) TaxID=670386 RepID=D3B147_HETP5|nr:hypothetical protein PPL_02017 [Heterostelium album PN500]EFA85021.1 hypothetical protein PPL_02017 [Heterostelium album PN500]|eukprot:XP_020437131.1 hypothetical protein PPL_02017 [Heterostelium album PN500]